MFQQCKPHITDISTLPFVCKLRNFEHVIGMQSNAAAIILSGSISGQIHWQISGHIPIQRDWSDFKNLNPVYP